jgi:hypothetical protein
LWQPAGIGAIDGFQKLVGAALRLLAAAD